MRGLTGWLQRRAAADRPAGRQPSTPPGIRIYVVGDVHGRCDLLDDVLIRVAAHTRANPGPESLLVLMGDYVDRGPHSASVLARLARLRDTRNVVALMGNHEAMMLSGLGSVDRLADWVRNGGQETLLSYGLDPTLRLGDAAQGRAFLDEAIRTIPADHLGCLRALRPCFALGDYFFAHAGVRPGRGLDQQRCEDLLWIREPFLSSSADFGAVVVHGHNPVPRPDIRDNRINVDTGAYITGRLTCLILQGTDRQVLGG
ncbi:metallophosphoesterase family protein [Methylobacterium sp. JK268]